MEPEEKTLTEGLIDGNYARCPRSTCGRLNWNEHGTSVKPGQVISCRGCQKKFKVAAKPAHRSGLLGW